MLFWDKSLYFGLCFEQGLRFVVAQAYVTACLGLFLSGGSVCGLLGLIAARPEGEGSVCLDFMQIMEPDLRFY